MYPEERIALEATLQEIYDRNGIHVMRQAGRYISIDELDELLEFESLSF